MKYPVRKPQRSPHKIETRPLSQRRALFPRHGYGKEVRFLGAPQTPSSTCQELCCRGLTPAGLKIITVWGLASWPLTAKINLTCQDNPRGNHPPCPADTCHSERWVWHSPLPVRPPARALSAGRRARGWGAAVNSNASLDSHSTLAPRSSGGCPGRGAVITSASTEAAGKGQRVQIVVSGSVQQVWALGNTRLCEDWKRPLLKGSCLPPLSTWLGAWRPGRLDPSHRLIGASATTLGIHCDNNATEMTFPADLDSPSGAQGTQEIRSVGEGLGEVWPRQRWDFIIGGR